MSTNKQSLRQRNAIARSRRAIYRAIQEASTPSMRDELIVIGQRGGLL